MAFFIVLAHFMGTAFLVLVIPYFLISSIFYPRKKSLIKMLVGVFTFVAISPVSAIYVWYKYNLIAAIVVGIIVFMVGQKLAEE